MHKNVSRKHKHTLGTELDLAATRCSAYGTSTYMYIYTVRKSCKGNNKIEYKISKIDFIGIHVTRNGTFYIFRFTDIVDIKYECIRDWSLQKSTACTLLDTNVMPINGSFVCDTGRCLPWNICMYVTYWYAYSVHKEWQYWLLQWQYWQYVQHTHGTRCCKCTSTTHTKYGITSNELKQKETELSTYDATKAERK